MAKTITCPTDCLEKHTTTRVMMARIETKLDNIESKLEENTKQHDEMINTFKNIADSKADKSELDNLKKELSEEKKSAVTFKDKILYTTIGVLFAISVYFISKYIVFR